MLKQRGSQVGGIAAGKKEGRKGPTSGQTYCCPPPLTRWWQWWDYLVSWAKSKLVEMKKMIKDHLLRDKMFVGDGMFVGG